jgi:hypothetical protein
VGWLWTAFSHLASWPLPSTCGENAAGIDNSKTYRREKMVCEPISQEYKDMIATAKRKWDESSNEDKDRWHGAMATDVASFILWWDTLKAIEQKYSIDVWTIARKMRWDWAYAIGRSLAKDYKDPNLKGLYDAFLSGFEGYCNLEYSEFNSEVMAFLVHKCPCYQHFKDMGKTDDEIKELAAMFCLADAAIMAGFNSKFDVFIPPRLLMRGDSCCIYRVEYKNKT